MADNVTANAGAGGATFATDDDGTAHWPYAKLAFGADNTQTRVSTTDPLPTVQTGALPAGTNNIGDVDILSIAAGDNNIGNVDIASIAAGDNNIGNVDVASIAAGDNNIGNVDIVTFPAEVHSADFDSGAGTDTTLAFGIAVPASGGAAVITGDTSNGLDVDVTRVGGNVTVINAGTFAVQVDGNALTSLQLIDDVVYAEDVAAQAADKGVAVLAVRRDADTSLVGTDNDYANLQVDANGYLKVEIFDGGGSHTVDNAGTFAVQVDGSALTALQLIDNTILVDDAAFTPATSSVNMAGFQADETATDSVDEGDAGAARMTLDRKQIVTVQPHTAGGLSIFRSLDLDESEEEVKATAGQVYSCWVTNTATATRWLKFYNATAANVTVGTTTPVITIGIPGNSSDDIAAHFAAGGHGIVFDTAITVAATTGVADADTGAPAANDVIINIFYK